MKKTTPTAKKTEKQAAASKPIAAKTIQKQTQNPYHKLFLWNAWLAGLHGVQGIAVLLLSTTQTFPITTDFLTLDKLAAETTGMPVLAAATHHLADLNLAQLVAVFFFLSSIAHLIVATVYRKRYEANLARGINRARWIEYSLSASTMIVGIAVLTGLSDFATLLSFFALTAIMNLCGLAMEAYNAKASRPNWLAYVIGCIAGIVPWVGIGLALFGSSVWGDATAPAFVYWIYVSMFVFFSCFAVNMLLQYKKVGKWSDYLYGERVYMILSLVAKTALAWQVFAGTLRP